MNACDAVLNMADRCFPAAFRPVGSFVLSTDRNVRLGYLERGQTGGFYLTAEGRRRLAALRRAKVAA